MTNSTGEKPNAQNKFKTHTFWDVFRTISTFLSTVVLGVVALWVNSTYNERQSIRAREAQQEQHQVGRVQALAAFMPHLSSTPETREVALFAISALGYPDLAIKLTQLRKPDEPGSGRDVADAIMRDAPASAPLAGSTGEPPPSKTPTGDIGWVYLGDYSAEMNQWSTRYLDFPPRASPDSLPGQIYAVRAQTGALNVRVGMPTEQGEFLRIARALSPGVRVRILEVHPWLTTGYIWARVADA